ncbi:MAG: SET domain-containing protein [Candidatus Pristimantibacillus sp.]
MIHPDTELRFVNEEVGVGVFATKFIPKGTIVWISDDLNIILDEDYVDSLDELRREMLIKYTYQENNGDYILNWDHSRYMNHSFQPTCIDTAYEFQLAARDINPGEQLTSDYGILGDDEDFEAVPEEGTSRTMVKVDDYLNYYQEWDEMAREAFKYFSHVDQPLKYLIKKEFVDKVNAVTCGKEPLDSILTTFIDELD